ncbi:cyclophilin-like fold protein [Aliarcobacter butzleri]
MKQTINILISILFVFITSIYAKEGETMKISVNSNGNTTIYELNNSSASKELYAQLPLNIKVENYSNNEKIFYPPNKLTTTNTSLAKNAKAGTLAYYAHWGDVVMFYKDFESANALYELGKVLCGAEYIENMSGTITIDKME